MNEFKIFDKASEIRDPQERQRFLTDACQGDPALRNSVEELLESAESATSFLESPAAAAVGMASLDQVLVMQPGVPPLPDHTESGVLGDYRILHEIGRGGMGVVYEAEQISLGRRVALKILTYASMLDGTQLTRFQNEARAAASLEHPNVVHVYSVGTERGVHYLAMQLIRGQSLDEMVKAERRKRDILEHPVDEPPRKSSGHEPTSAFSIPDAAASEEKDVVDTVVDAAPAATTRHDVDDQVWIRSVVELAIQAAEALEHAHRMGIVHRDIKPSNLLIDADQHLWVADFGLALIEADANLTTSGSMIGTLRYMSPEQLRGDRHVLDHHTDIYSLGTTFYEMLTLRPAFPDSDVTRLMQRIPNEEPTAPHKLNSAIPRDLETVILKAMSKDHEDRYGTAGELAADLRRVLDDEPIHAKRLPTLERVTRWSRRHKSLVTAGVVLLILASVGLLVGYIGIAREKTRTEIALRQANANLNVAMQTVDKLLTNVAEEALLDQPQLEGVRRKMLEDALQSCQALLATQGDDPQARWRTGMAYQHTGKIYSLLGKNEAAKEAYENSIKLFSNLIDQAGDGPHSQQYRYDLAESHRGFGKLMRTIGRQDKTEKAFRKALELTQQLVEESAEETDWLERRASIVTCLGVHLVDTGRLKEAERAFRDAEQIYRQHADLPDWRFGLALARQNLAGVLFKLSRFAESEAAYRDALGSMERLAEEYPEVVKYRERLALISDNLGTRPDLGEKPGPRKENEELVRQAIEIRERLKAEFPTVPKYAANLATSYTSLAVLLDKRQDFQAAEKMYRRAIDCTEELTASYPTVPEYFYRALMARFNLTICLTELGRRDEAEQQYRKVLSGARRLVAENPDTVTYHRLLGFASHGLAKLFKETERLAEAEEAFRETLTIREELTVRFPDAGELWMHLGETQYYMGNILRMQADGRSEQAEQFYRSAVESFSHVATDELPRVCREELAHTHRQLAEICHEQKRLAEAEHAARQAYGIARQMATAFPQRRPFLAELYVPLGIILTDLKELQEAEQVYRAALALYGDLKHLAPRQTSNAAVTLANLGGVLRDTGRPDEAEQVFRAALALYGDLKHLAPSDTYNAAVTLANLGGIFGDTGRPNEAEQAYRQALPLARQAAAEGTGPDISAQIESTMANLRGQDLQPNAEPANSTDRQSDPKTNPEAAEHPKEAESRPSDKLKDPG